MDGEAIYDHPYLPPDSKEHEAAERAEERRVELEEARAQLDHFLAAAEQAIQRLEVAARAAHRGTRVCDHFALDLLNWIESNEPNGIALVARAMAAARAF